MPQTGQVRGSLPSPLSGKTWGPSILVQRLEHVADAQVLDLADRRREVAPEVAQHLAPLEVAVGDEVELLLQVGGEVVLDVALEEALQEGDDQPPFVLGDEPRLSMRT